MKKQIKKKFLSNQTVVERMKHICKSLIKYLTQVEKISSTTTSVSYG